MKKIDRDELLEELKLRKHIQKIIKEVRIKNRIEENKLREYIFNLIKESAIDDETPHHSTGINVLEELLKKIIPVLEDGYKTLTTDENQRKSYRAHIIHAVQGSLAPHIAQDEAGQEEEQKYIPIDEENDSENDLSEDEDTDIAINIGSSDDENNDKKEEFIDIDGGDGRSEKEKEEEEKLNQFSIEGEDATGRNVALQTYQKVEANIVDTYATLENEEDKDLFYSYLLTNLKLYFDKFETELQPSLEEPTTVPYEEEKEKAEDEKDEADVASGIEKEL